MRTVKIGEAMSQAWEGTKNNWAMLLALGAIYIAISIAINVVQKLIGPSAGAVGALGLWLLGNVVNVLFVMLSMKFCLRVAEQKGGKVELFSEMELRGDDMLRYFLTYLLMTVTMLAAFAICLAPVAVLAVVTAGVAIFKPESGAWKALIGPGLVCLLLGLIVVSYLSLALSQMIYACIHQGLGPVESFRESWRLTTGVKGELFLLGILCVGLVLGGLICLLVGIIPAMMVLVLAQPVVYLSLLEQSGPRPVS